MADGMLPGAALPPPGARYSIAPRLRFLLALPDGPAALLHSVPAVAPEYEVRLPPSPTHLVVLNLTSAPGQSYSGHFDGRPRRFRSGRGQHMVLPAGSESVWRGATDRDEGLCLGLPAAWLAEFAGRHGLTASRAALAPRFEGRDPMLGTISGHLHALSREGPVSPHLVEHLTMLAALRLLGFTPSETARAGTLAPHRLRRVMERIEAELDERFTLAAMAETAGLSLYHFARCFRRSVGMSPHAYILSRRIARAQDLLRRTDLPLAEVALRCGFADQAHFTTAFRRATGETPRRWRLAAGGRPSIGLDPGEPRLA